MKQREEWKRMRNRSVPQCHWHGTVIQQNKILSRGEEQRMRSVEEGGRVEKSVLP